MISSSNLDFPSATDSNNKEIDLLIPGYHLREIIHESRHFVIYRATREKVSQQVAIKTLKNDYPSQEQIARFHFEHTLYQRLKNIKGVAKAIELIEIGNKPALVLEYISGTRITQLLNPQEPDFLDVFLKLALQLAQTLGEIHQQRIIHKNLNPDNILWDSKTASIKIVNFGIATELSREKQIQDTHLLKGALPYISPEQTGRMNRIIDYRSDFYSLGVTLYQLYCGELPYQVDDDNPLSWIHCHIARKPKPLLSETSVEQALVAIINKLLAKNAEDRYQSAFGLKNDLAYCLQQRKKQGVIGEFHPGNKDISDHFVIQQKLYGREQEITELMNVFSDTRAGVSKMFLVSGFSGIGKSALINEVRKPIIARHGYFITGKFDQFQRNIPYSAVAQAFRGLMRQLLTESKDALQLWKHQFLEELGKNGQVIIDFIPELEQIIGPQPKVPHLGTEENQNRFKRLVLRFQRLLSSKEHPLVLFIDDLQWCDSASLELIKLFMLNQDNQHFLFIGAYRNNEVDEHHALTFTRKELIKANVALSEIELHALTLAHVTALVADSLYRSEQDTAPLAELVMDKTAGNPFFVYQFLKHIHETGLLFFNIEKSSWDWNLQKIKQQKSSDNVVDLVITKIEKFPGKTRELLTMAACIGNRFDVQTLASISQQPLVETAANLWPAVQSGLVLTEGDGHALLKEIRNSERIEKFYYPKVSERFLHDRVQQAAYSLLEADPKKRIHLCIARLLLKDIPDAELENHYFDIVEHYHKSFDLIQDKKEYQHLAYLNLQSGIRAKEATAYAPALKYFNQANLCLQTLASPKTDALQFQVDKGRVECLFLLGDTKAGLELSECLLQSYSSIERKIEVNNVLILYYGGAGQMDKAIDIALDSLGFFAINLPRKPTKVQLMMELARARIKLGRKNTDELMTLPFFKEKETHIVFSLLKELIAPTYLQGQTNLLPYIILRMFNLTLTHGNGPVSSFAYSGYALLWAKLGDYREAYRFGVLAMEFNSKIDNPAMEARCYFMATSFALYWGQPLLDSRKLRQTGLQKLVDTGEYFWASYIYLFGFWQEVVFSTSLDDLFFMTERDIRFSEKAQQIEPFHVHILHRNLFKNLAGLTANPDSLNLDGHEEQEALAYFKHNKTSTMGRFYHVVCRLLMHYHLGQYQQAIDIATRADIDEDVIRDGTYTRVIYTFFTCLAILSLSSSAFKRGTLARHYHKRKRDIKRWSLLYPENFAYMWHLLLAEESRVKNQENLALEHFEHALEHARQMQSLFFESLANELYAKFWLLRGNKKLASVLMQEACYNYYRWGASGKLAFLKQQYATLFFQHHFTGNTFHQFPNQGTAELPITDDDHSMTTSARSSLDLKTLLEASQTLSREIVLENLLQKLMHVLIKNAGAQKGCLILKKNNHFFIEAECKVEHDQEAISHDVIALDQYTELSKAIIRYVIRSKEILVLGDAITDERFATDTYLRTHKVKSVLCVPLLDKEHLSGVLYLENNLANNSFTADRVETLQILSAEIVIALENARLYRTLEEYSQTLEEKVEERTSVLSSVNKTLQAKNDEVEKSKKIIEEKNSNITKSIQYAQKIQQAMLPQEKKIAEHFPDYFLIYRPKQIVSGDFYWFSCLAGKKFLVVADCTGHGVPGAFLSTIGNMLLNKIIIDRRNISPASILQRMHEELMLTLRQQGKTRQANESMDVAICQIDEHQQTIVFAGARRPLYIYRQNENKLLKIRGNMKPIGGRQKEKTRTFIEHVVKYNNKDIFYLCSDGLIDQQNKLNKKLGSKGLESLLTNVASSTVTTQKQHIEAALDKHQGDEQQRDDITLLAIRLLTRTDKLITSSLDLTRMNS